MIKLTKAEIAKRVESPYPNGMGMAKILEIRRAFSGNASNQVSRPFGNPMVDDAEMPGNIYGLPRPRGKPKSISKPEITLEQMQRAHEGLY